MTQPTRSDTCVPVPDEGVIQIRTSLRMKAMLARAASLRGQSLSEFMLDSARREAEKAILDQREFFLDAEQHEAFLAVLDAPPASSPALIALMNRTPAWER